MSSDADGGRPRSSESLAAAEGVFAFADALVTRSQGDQEQPASEILQFVRFALRDRDFGLPILQCREIVRVSTITRVPEAPVQVRGVANLRGRVVPVVDARLCLGMEPTLPTSRSRLLVVDAAGRWLALLVDRVASILKLPRGEIQPPPEDSSIPGCIGIASVESAAVTLLDVERLLRLLHPTPTPAPTTARSDEA
jgi:purine-binding chemotaxis protein CheW